ncbi:MAG TPA: VOC family protein [Myxococcales bacterium LLY-WYZ-16_1]|jgi:PhnB protein|nr:VOC family protein [Myxococcales bacterium LLY-WYZ-16_1]
MKLPVKTTAVTPHITVRDVEAAARFYERAFGFRIQLLLPGGPHGTIRHAEVGHEGCTIMIGPESPQRGIRAPVDAGGTPPVSMFVYVDDVDAVHQRAVEAGAIELLPPSEQFFGARTCVLADPDGHQWMMAQHQEELSESDMRKRLEESNQGEGASHAADAPRRKPRVQGPIKRPAPKTS